MKISISKANTWKMCQRKYYYQYILRLRKRYTSDKQEMGIVLHDCLERHYKGGVWEEYLDEYEETVWNKLFDEEKARYGDLPNEAHRIMRGYVKAWAIEDQAWEVLGVPEEMLEWKAGGERTIVGKPDLVFRDHLGVWVVDHKTTGNIPEGIDMFHMQDIQTAIYCKLVEENLGVDEIAGVIYNYISTKAPSIPQITQKGRLSKRAIVTDHDTLTEAIRNLGNDPNDEEYADMFRNLDPKRFYHRARLPKPEQVVNAMVNDLLLTAWEIADRTEELFEPTRNLTRNCQYLCDFPDICRSDLLGFEPDYTGYITRDGGTR